MLAPTPEDKAEIDVVVRAFFAAFTTAKSGRIDLGVLHSLFAPRAVIVKTCGPDPVVYDVDGFIEPRQKLLEGGMLADFREWEVSERTDIFGGIAQRFCRYRKSGEQRDDHGSASAQNLIPGRAVHPSRRPGCRRCRYRGP